MIHPTALIGDDVRLGSNVHVGPYTVIEGPVDIGDDCRIGPHVVIRGPTRLGRRNRIFQFASVGEECQDKKYAGEPTELHVGDDNVIRECVTLQRGTVQDRGLTRVGSRGLFMAYVHVAHDCVVGDDVILANTTQLAGHVQLGDYTILGGGTLVHQYCRVGAHAMTGSGTVVFKDIPAFVTAQGNPAHAYTINAEGLRRRGFTPESIRALKQAFRTVYRKSLTLENALTELAHETDPAVSVLRDSLRDSTRGIVR